MAAAAVLALTGCAPLGSEMQTNKQYDAAIGSNLRGTHVEVLNSLFVDNGNKTATYSASLINRDATPHVLKGVEVTTVSGAPITSSLKAPPALKEEVPYLPGTLGDIIMTGAFPAGGFVNITFTFDNAAPVTLNAPIVARTPMYSSVATAPVVIVCQDKEKPVATGTDIHPC